MVWESHRCSVFCAGLLNEFEGKASLPAVSDTLYFGHKYGLHGVLSGVENLRYHCGLRDQRPTEGELIDALSRFQLGASMLSRVANLSEGQRKRVALSKLVLANESLWLLDEAFSSLDTEGLSTLTALCARMSLKVAPCCLQAINRFRSRSRFG